MIHEYCPSVKNALGPDHDGGESGSRICVRQDCALNALCTSTPLRLVTPAAEKRTIVGKHTAVRRPNKELRAREHLTPAEVERLIDAARKNREGHRDGTMILLAYRHGLRASELIDLRWDQVDFNQAVLHVRRVKNGTPATHPITGGELRTLRRLQREQNPKSAFVFVSMRGSPFTVSGFRRMSSAPRWMPGSRASRPTRTCCATRADTSWPTTVSIRAHFKPIWATKTSCTR